LAACFDIIRASRRESGMENKTPLHFWIISILGLLWNSMGAFDFTMTNFNGAQYLAAFSNAERTYIQSFPLWAIVFWGLGTWGAFAGSVMMILRRRWAVVAFSVALFGLAGTTLYELSADKPASFDTPGTWAFLAMIWIITIFLLWYSLRMRAAAIMR
jgi:hypothetical protein